MGSNDTDEIVESGDSECNEGMYEASGGGTMTTASAVSRVDGARRTRIFSSSEGDERELAVELDGDGEGVRDEDVVDDDVEHWRLDEMDRDGV